VHIDLTTADLTLMTRAALCVVCCMQVAHQPLQQLGMGCWAWAAQPQLQAAAGRVRGPAAARRTVPAAAATVTAAILAAPAPVLPAAEVCSSLVAWLQQAQQQSMRKVGRGQHPEQSRLHASRGVGLLPGVLRILLQQCVCVRKQGVMLTELLQHYDTCQVTDV
jgi:hypothetical protein